VSGNPRFRTTRLTSPVAILQAATLPLSLISKAPQIITNHRNRSTGNLSAFAVFNALLGCLARLFTTKQEVNDPLIFWGFAGAALLNAVLAIQMISYWRSGEVVWHAVKQKRRVTEEGIAEPVRASVEEKSPPGKRWARKLD
jgi:mannose-P-dolichol utilization defect protein 1